MTSRNVTTNKRCHLVTHNEMHPLDWSKFQSYVSLFVWLPDTSATRNFGIKTLWDTSAPISRHFGTDLKTLWHQKRGTRHFDSSAVNEEKPGHFDPGQFRCDTAPPVIRLKLWHRFCGAEVSRCRSVLWPKCPAPICMPKFTICSSDRSLQCHFQFVDILLHSGDICDRVIKLSETVPKFWVIWLPNFWGDGRPNFWPNFVNTIDWGAMQHFA